MSRLNYKRVASKKYEAIMTEKPANWKDTELTVLRRMLRAERERCKALEDIIESLRWDLDKIFDEFREKNDGN